MAATPESKVKAAIKKYLTSIGAWHFMPIGGPYSSRGIPDIIGCINGWFFGIEVKAPGRKGATTDLQKMQLSAIHVCGGGIAIVADSVDDVRPTLELLRYHRDRRAA